MKEPSEQLSAIRDIKQMMERSSRFISLSGWSGISAGICALVGAWFAHDIIGRSRYAMDNDLNVNNTSYPNEGFVTVQDFISNRLFIIAGLTFFSALCTAFIFTYIRSHKNDMPIWGTTARRLLLNVSIPMVAGGAFLLRMIQTGAYGLIAPGCLLFYGLALINGSKYTLGEVKYLGYSEVIVGIIGCWFMGWGLHFWAFGFGILHIAYGAIMLNRYESRKAS